MAGLDKGYSTPECCLHVACAYRTGIVGLDGALACMAFRRGYRRGWGAGVTECVPGGWLDVRALATGYDWTLAEAVA